MEWVTDVVGGLSIVVLLYLFYVLLKGSDHR